MGSRRDPRVDRSIARARPFAKPILRRIRVLVRLACPDAQETIKWGMPTFLYRGRILCGMSGFAAHAALWFRNASRLKRRGVLPPLAKTAMGSFGRLTTVGQLPSETAFRRIVRTATGLIDRETA